MDIAIREAVTEYWSILSGAWPRDDDQGSARQTEVHSKDVV